MASNVPVVRQISWITLIPHLILLILLDAFYYAIDAPSPYLLGPLTYLILSFALKRMIPKSHTVGMKLVKQKKFEEAIPLFQKSVEFFSQNSWLDKYRFITMLSSSKMTYREMGLCNVAFCYGQIGNGAKAIEFYQKVLADYPNNGLAQSGLNMLKSGNGQMEADT
jgi:tetratricopeptide (TPR) repeat protein